MHDFVQNIWHFIFFDYASDAWKIPGKPFELFCSYHFSHYIRNSFQLASTSTSVIRDGFSSNEATEEWKWANCGLLCGCIWEIHTRTKRWVFSGSISVIVWMSQSKYSTKNVMEASGCKILTMSDLLALWKIRVRGWYLITPNAVQLKQYL